MHRTFMLWGMGLVVGLGTLAATPVVQADFPANPFVAKQTLTLRQEVMSWLDDNYSNKYPETSAQLRKWVGAALAAGEDWVVTFGPGVMNSGKPYQIYVFAGRFYQFPLSPAQARKLVSGPDRIAATTGKRGYQVEPVQITLSQPRINGTDNLDPRKEITGEVSYAIEGELPAGSRARLTFKHGRTTTQLLCSLDTLHSKKGTLRFSFRSLHDEKSREAEPLRGPLAVFLDVCTVKQLDRDPYLEIKVFSNSVPVLLNVGTGISQTAPSSGLVGTRWQFPGTDTVVKFLAGGKLLWNGQPMTGYWVRNGNSITINVNDFTLFELTQDGAEMQGTWKRLQGEGVGEKHPSGLRRLQD